MAFGSKDKLVEAATGKPPAPPQNPLESTYGKALVNKIAAPADFSDFLVGSGLATPVSPTQGLSAKGKYGGYYTASDLDTAIRGEAAQRNAQVSAWADSLRNLASKTMGSTRRTGTGYATEDIGQVGEIAGMTFGRPKAGAPAKAMFGGYEESFMEAPEAQLDLTAADYDPIARTALRQSTQAKETASMAKQTPMSAYARAVATQRYGVNPALAAGMYGTEFDVESQENLRDQYYLDHGYTGYADYLKQQDRDYTAASREEAAIQADLDEAFKTGNPRVIDPVLAAYGISPAEMPKPARDLYYLSQVSEALGFSASKLPTDTGMSADEIYAVVRDADMGPKITGAIENVTMDINQGDENAANATVNELLRDPDTQAIGRIVSAYVTRLLKSIRAPGEAATSLYNTELNLPFLVD